LLPALLSFAFGDLSLAFQLIFFADKQIYPIYGTT
jgi:hypothetical protein